VKRIEFAIAFQLLLVPFQLNAEVGCIEKAYTQQEMNSCAGLDYESADSELNRVYNEIKRVYSDEPEFLEKMKSSQLAWIKLRDADLEMYFPKEKKRFEYGSVFPMCASGIKTRITIQRIEFLKQWLKGVEEGDVCSGSVRNAWYLNKSKKNVTKVAN